MIELPSFTNNLYFTREEALLAPTSQFELKEDLDYKYYFNHLYKQLDYNSELYQNSQNSSPRFQQHTFDIAQRISQKIEKDSKIIEIGCGKGHFFELLQSLGFSNLLGFDSAYQGRNNKIRKRYFSKEDFNLKAQVIILRHTLEHIPNPYDFLTNILNINNNVEAKLFIEVPCFSWILRQNAYWDLDIEHCNYFIKESFYNMMPGSNVQYVFEDQYLLVEASFSNVKAGKIVHTNSKVCVLEDFFPSLKSKTSFSKNSTISPRYNRYWVWGSATKGVLYLWHNKLKQSNFSPPLGMVDIDVSKHNKYIPCLGYKIISPDNFYENCRDGDTLYISNPAYKKEIEGMIELNTSKSIIIKSI